MRPLFLLQLFTLAITLTAQPLIDSLDHHLTQIADSGYFSGNILLAEGDQILLRKSYGYADFANKVPLKEENILELASVSKQFTAAGISLLVKAEQLDLDAPIKDYLPELSHYPALTTRHLIHHTGGLPDYMGLMSELDTSPEFITNQFILDYFQQRQPAADFNPGEKFAYSNTGYVVLASLIERVSEQSFGEFLKAQIFQPLGMVNTQVYRRRYEKRQVAGFVPGYVSTPDNNYVIPDSLDYYGFVRTLDGVQGDGMVNSTLDDLYLWDRALAANKLLDTSLIFTPGKTNEGTSVEYGFGFQVQQHPKYGYTIGHSGGWPGMSTFIFRFPETDRVLILLRNDDGGISDRINPLKNGLHALHGLPLDLESLIPVEVATVDSARVAAYVGTYVISPDFKLNVMIKQEKFMVQATGQTALNLAETEEADRFLLTDVDAALKFHRDENGTINSLTLFQAGQEITGKKE